MNALAVLHPSEVDEAWLTAILPSSRVLPAGRVVTAVCEPCGTGVERSARGDELCRVWTARTAAQTRDLDSSAVLAARG